MREPLAHRSQRPKVSVVGGMMAYFESIMPKGFRDDRRDHVSKVVGPLADEFDLDDLGLWADSTDTISVADRVRANPPQVFLLVPTMAVPPADIVALARSAKVPVVIACAHDLTAVTETYDMRTLCRHSTNVGTTMLGAMFYRRNDLPQPLIVAGFLDDPEFHRRLRMALRTAALSTSMRGLRVGRLGHPMPGYDHVGLNIDEARMGNIELVDIALDEWVACHAAVTNAEMAAFREERLPDLVPPQTDWEPGEDLDRSIRMAIALDRIAEERALDCGSLTCRGPYGVELVNGAIGCLATTLMTGSGRPFSATGDLVTAVAMFIGRYLSGATLYCELDAIDREKDAFLVANTGEADLGWCPKDGAARIFPAGVRSGRDVPGVVLSHDLTSGPATMLGLLPDQAADTFRLIALEGETLGPARTALEVTHGWFRSSRRPALDAFEAWAESGATHHGALSRQHLAEAARWLGRLTGYAIIEIGIEGNAHGSQ